MSVSIIYIVIILIAESLSVLKGLLERVFITFSLLVGYPQALTLFAALKIATRIKDESKISSDFYFIGNIISVSLALLYTVLIEQHILLIE